MFDWVRARPADRGSVTRERMGALAPAMEANAALCSIRRRRDGESYREMLARMAQPSAVPIPTRLKQLDQPPKGERHQRPGDGQAMLRAVSRAQPKGSFHGQRRGVGRGPEVQADASALTTIPEAQRCRQVRRHRNRRRCPVAMFGIDSQDAPTPVPEQAAALRKRDVPT